MASVLGRRNSTTLSVSCSSARFVAGSRKADSFLPIKNSVERTLLRSSWSSSTGHSGDSSAIFCRSVEEAENSRSAASAYPSCFSRTTALRISPAVNVVPNISRAVSGSLCASSTMTVQASGRMGFKPLSRCIQSASQRFWLQIWNKYRFCPHSVKCRR